MTLIRWQPRSDIWDPLASLADIQEEMNRLFNTSLRRVGAATEGVLSFPIDVVEEKDHLVVRANLPGLRRDDVSVTLQDGYLTIKGEKKVEATSKDANWYRQERAYGSFSRTVELPVAVEPKKIEAQFRDGVLTVTLPKAEEAKPKQIEIKVG
jgi:HSP20 family protein